MAQVRARARAMARFGPVQEVLHVCVCVFVCVCVCLCVRACVINTMSDL